MSELEFWDAAFLQYLIASRKESDNPDAEQTARYADDALEERNKRKLSDGSVASLIDQSFKSDPS